MDEVLFRSSQKLENLQVQLSLAASQGKHILQQYSYQTKTLISGAWDSSRIEQIKENIQDLWLLCVTLVHELKENLTVLPKNIYQSFIKTLGKQWTKQNICFGCVGFLIGSLVGISIGMALRKYQPVVHYMQAVQCTTYSGIEYASVIEDAVAPYTCEKDEVLVNVKAGSVHAIDAQICNGYGRALRKRLCKYFRYSNFDLPATLGRDCSGIITDVGQNVTRLEIGDEVWLTVPFWAPGTLCQTVLVKEAQVARKPKNIGYEGAASLPFAGSIALSALEEAGINQENAHLKRILVLAACTPVGCVLVQVLRLWNAHITATCYKRAVPVAKALGANEVIVIPENQTAKNKADLNNHSQPNDDVVVKELELLDTFDVIFITKDCQCKEEDLRKLCSENGTISKTLPPNLASDSYGFLMRFIFGLYVRCKCGLQRLFSNEIGNFGEYHICYVVLDQLNKLVESGDLQTVVDKVYHPHDIEIALRHIQSPESIGSTVITFR